MTVRRLAEVQPDSFDFTPENRAWVDRQIKKYPAGRQASAVMALLRRAQQQHQGWLPKPAIERTAEILDMPFIRVLEIATFYTMYNLSPVGTFFVQFCGTTPCVLCGAHDIRAVLEQRVGPMNAVSSDGKFSWLEVECLGACCNAPMVQINDDYYEDLTPENFRTLLDDLAAGRPVRTGSQTGRRTSEPVGGLTSLTTIYGPDGKGDTFGTQRVADDAAVLTAANQDPAFDAALAARDGASPADAVSATAGDGTAGHHAELGKSQDDMGHGGLDGQRKTATARPIGSVADTETRTDDPVGIGQVESSAVHTSNPQSDPDGQGGPANPSPERTAAKPAPRRLRSARERRKPTKPKDQSDA